MKNKLIFSHLILELDGDDMLKNIKGMWYIFLNRLQMSCIVSQIFSSLKLIKGELFLFLLHLDNFIGKTE